MKHDTNSMKVFWGCWIALITTSMAFSSRIALVYGAWAKEFDLDPVQQGELFGAGIWPFAISIILFSLIIDKIGYRTAMFVSFTCYALYGILAWVAKGTEDTGSAYAMLYWASIILGLGNGTVEAFINPVVATLFKDEKPKWLNILHAGWPGGLVLGGLIVVALGDYGEANWMLLVLTVMVPAVVFLVMLATAAFPVNERVSMGATYREMLAEFGVIGALIAIYLISAQLQQVFDWWGTGLTIGATVVLTAAYGFYARSLGRPMMIVLVLIMIPLAITELGTDGWITTLMEVPVEAAGGHAILVLVYTSLIMMILRFNVGPIINALTPLGLLMTAAALAIVGLFLLSGANGLFMIFLAATVYALGKTYFWPTMLGVVSEQFPRGGALSLNAIAGIGMLSVGIIGAPLIGYFQETNTVAAIEEQHPELAGQLTTEQSFVMGEYQALDSTKVAALPQATQDDIQPTIRNSRQGALKRITIFPMIMLVGYIGLFVYFKSKGGYRPAVGEGTVSEPPAPTR